MELATFATQALADFRTVGAFAPSSRYLAQAMLSPLSLTNARVVVELGPGTGAMTQALLELLPRECKLFAFEINPRFSTYLRSNVRDARLTVIDASAEFLREEMQKRGYDRVDGIVSSLALGLMPDAQRRGFLANLARFLDEGIFTQYKYVPCWQMEAGRIRRFDLTRLLEGYFSSVRRRTIWRNLPPAYVFVCRTPRHLAARNETGTQPPFQRENGFRSIVP